MRKKKNPIRKTTSIYAIFTLVVVLLFWSASTTHEAVISFSKPQTKSEWIQYYLAGFPKLTYTEVDTIIFKESSDNPKCKTWENSVEEYSYGPGQVLGSTARLLGFEGDLDDLCTWKYGLYYSMLYLNNCKDRAERFSMDIYGKIDPYVVRRHTFSLYNAGNARYTKKEIRGEIKKVYKNRSYVLQCEYIYWNKYNLSRREVYNVYSACN